MGCANIKYEINWSLSISKSTKLDRKLGITLLGLMGQVLDYYRTTTSTMYTHTHTIWFENDLSDERWLGRYDCIRHACTDW